MGQNPGKCSQVKVWNENIEKDSKGVIIGHTLEEHFKGKKISIPPGDYVLMGRAESIQFKGQYHPLKKNGMGQQTNETKKIIRLEAVVGGAPVKEKSVLICQQDGTEHASQAALDKYIAENFADKLHDQKFAEEFTDKVKKTSKKKAS